MDDMRMLIGMAPTLACVLLFWNTAAAESRSYALSEERPAFRAGPELEAAQNNFLSVITSVNSAVTKSQLD